MVDEERRLKVLGQTHRDLLASAADMFAVRLNSVLDINIMTIDKWAELIGVSSESLTEMLKRFSTMPSYRREAAKFALGQIIMLTPRGTEGT